MIGLVATSAPACEEDPQPAVDASAADAGADRPRDIPSSSGDAAGAVDTLGQKPDTAPETGGGPEDARDAAAPEAGVPGDGGTDGPLASGVEVRGDRRVPFAPNNDVEFIDFFVPHHRMATEMAQMVIDRGASAELKSMAMKMKTDQTAEIDEMRAARMALVGTADSPPPPADPTQARNMVHMKTLSGTALDRMFLMEMIQHHAGALPVAHRGLPFLKRADMQSLARRIGGAQAKEIGELKEMLGELRESDHTPGGQHGPDAGAPDEDRSLVGDRRVSYTPPGDVGFTDFFIVHHEAAIEMADMVIDKGASNDVKSLARMISEAQTSEIALMKSARRGLGVPEAPAPPPADPLMQADMQRMRTLTGTALDRMFLDEMIPHHASGLPTAHRAIPNLVRAEMRALARDIFNAQADEIGEMHALLSKESRDGGTD